VAVSRFAYDTITADELPLLSEVFTDTLIEVWINGA
jgi:hypothetical protein